MFIPPGGNDSRDDWTEAARARLGTVLRGFALTELLGVGGQSAVYAATNAQGARFAMKVMRLGYTGNDKVRERLAREVRAANALAGVGGVRVLDHGLEDGVAFLVMELLEGETLRARASSCGGALPADEVRRIGIALLAILAEAHARGLTHRDIKPENVFLTRDGGIRILDFGLAREEGAADLTRSTATVGTPAFMAPEQARGRTRETGVRTDVWGAGATLFSVLAGRYVHLAETAGEMVFVAGTEPAPPLASVCPAAPAALCRVIDRALRFQPDERWSSALEMREALARSTAPSELFRDAVAETLGEEDAPMSLTTHPIAGLPRSRVWLTTGSAIVVLLALGSGPLHRLLPSARGVSAVAVTPALSCEAADPSDLFVGATESERCRFVSITAALRAAVHSRAPQKTIHLARGLYSARTTGDVFPIELRGDIALVGDGADITVIEGIGTVIGLASDSSAHDAIGATIVTGDARGTTRIAGIAVRSGAREPSSRAFGVFCDRGGAAGALGARSRPNLLVENVAFGATYDTGLFVTRSAEPLVSGCSARVTSSRFDGSL
jgi:serine/threonine protein kinase